MKNEKFNFLYLLQFGTPQRLCVFYPVDWLLRPLLGTTLYLRTERQSTVLFLSQV